MGTKAGRMIVGALVAAQMIACGGGGACDDFAAMCRSCGTAEERSLCEDILAGLKASAGSGLSADDLCRASVDAFVGTSCRR